MALVNSQDRKNFAYSSQTIARAVRSLRCSPFNLCLFTAMRCEGVSVSVISGNSGVQNGYTQFPMSELAADNALSWLIQVGVLRREVDGQGLTDSFRLTPLGRQITEQYPHDNWQPPSLIERLLNTLHRWVRLPW